MPNPNLEQLIAAAALLRPMLGDLVFVGGAGVRRDKSTTSRLTESVDLP
jgi:hypothetical protein